MVSDDTVLKVAETGGGIALVLVWTAWLSIMAWGWWKKLRPSKSS